MYFRVKLCRLHAFLACALLAPACADSTDDPPEQEGATTGEFGSTTEAPEPVETGSSSSSSGGDAQPHDGFGPAQGITLEEVVVNQGVAVPVWAAADGFIDGNGRNAPLLQHRAGAVFARFSVEDGWEPREITARLHLGEQTLEAVMMVDVSSTYDPHTWFGWVLEADDAVAGAQFQVELLELDGTGDPVLAPDEGVAPVGFEDVELALEVVMVPLSIEAEDCNETRTPTKAELELAHTFALQQFPVQEVDARVSERGPTVQLEAVGDGLTILAELSLWRAAEGISPNAFVVGIPPTCGGPFDFGAFRGARAVGVGDTGVRTGVLTDVELERNLAFLLTYMTDRLRVDCPAVEYANPDPDYPYRNGRTGSWGFGILDNQLHEPLANYDPLSGCSPKWVSDYGYRAAYDALRELNDG